MFGALKGTAIRLGAQKAPLLSALLIRSFTWMATLLFWFFWNRWPGHWWSGIQGCRGRCRLFRILLMEGADQFPEVYDCR